MRACAKYPTFAKDRAGVFVGAEGTPYEEAVNL